MAACCTPQQLKEKDIDPSKLLDIREDDEFLYKNNGEDEDEEEQDKGEEMVRRNRQHMQHMDDYNFTPVAVICVNHVVCLNQELPSRTTASNSGTSEKGFKWYTNIN